MREGKRLEFLVIHRVFHIIHNLKKRSFVDKSVKRLCNIYKKFLESALI